MCVCVCVCLCVYVCRGVMMCCLYGLLFLICYYNYNCPITSLAILVITYLVVFP